MNRIQEALMHLHEIILFVPDEVQDKLCKVEQLLKEELLEQKLEFQCKERKTGENCPWKADRNEWLQRAVRAEEEIKRLKARMSGNEGSIGSN